MAAAADARLRGIVTSSRGRHGIFGSGRGTVFFVCGSWVLWQYKKLMIKKQQNLMIFSL